MYCIRYSNHKWVDEAKNNSVALLLDFDSICASKVFRVNAVLKEELHDLLPKVCLSGGKDVQARFKGILGRGIYSISKTIQALWVSDRG